MAKGFKYAKIVLDEPRAIYYSGQLLNGHIECELSQPLNYTSITLNYNGKATVHWTETETEEYNGVQRKVDINYGGSEEYFNVTQCISGGMGVNLQPGLHKIAFQFLIPPTAPSSYKGDKGQVTYTVTAYIDYPDISMERNELSTEFEVVAPMDLNKTDERVRRPLELEIEEFYSCCCNFNSLFITLSLPATGYCPGQHIPIHVKAKTSIEVKGIVFQLIKKECFHSREPKSDYIPPEEVLFTVKTKPILRGVSREFTVDMVVPDMIAPNLENCTIIDVGFFLKVRVKISGCNDDYEDDAELFIGLVPISTLVQQYVHPLQNDLPNAPIPQNLPNVRPPIENTTAHENNASYSYANTGYPNTNVYSNPINDNPMGTVLTGNIGFVVPGTSPGSNTTRLANSQSSFVPYPNFAAPSAPPAS